MKKPILTMLIILSVASFSLAEEASKKKKVKYREVQKVSFDGDDISGVARNPMSSYLMQNKVMQFLPLYQVKEKMDQDLVRSLEVLR